MPPIPKKITIEGGNRSMAVEWADGRRSLYSYRYLRDKCPCATCTDAHGNGSPKRDDAVKSSNPLPMFESPLKPEKVELVGRYALNVTWSDGHSTGIYTFDYLRELDQEPG